MAEALTATALIALMLAWLIYPVLMWVVGSLRGNRLGQIPFAQCAASVVIATREDPEAVARRVEDISRHREELQQLEIIVSVDYSGASQASQYRHRLGKRAIVVVGDPPGGKAAALNAGVRTASHAIVIFTDTAQEFLPGSLKGLAQAVSHTGIGAATGYLGAASNRRSILLRTFWAYESWLRRAEARVDSLVGVTGAIYSIKKHLWHPLPAGLINDDVYVALWVAGCGYRVITCETAVAIDRRIFTPRQEFRRRVRTLTGILQLCILRPSILNPLQNRLWLQFLCHKLLRFTTPYWILICVCGAAAQLTFEARAVTTLLVVGALIGAAISPRGSVAAAALRQLGWAALILWAPMVATSNALRGNWNVWAAPSRKPD